MHPSRITLFREIFESIISQQTLVETTIERLPDYSWSLFVYAVVQSGINSVARWYRYR